MIPYPYTAEIVLTDKRVCCPFTYSQDLLDLINPIDPLFTHRLCPPLQTVLFFVSACILAGVSDSVYFVAGVIDILDNYAVICSSQRSKLFFETRI